MPETRDAFYYITYLRSRWPWIAACSCCAVLLAIVLTLMLPVQYTATARVVIDPPAGADLRSAMAVSPIYLESLRTYEEFATSDSLFQKAVNRFGLRKLVPAGSIEAIKRRVLGVGIVRNTRVLEISATLPDPHKAQALAEFLAQSTVSLNRGMMAEGDRELLEGIEREESEARANVEKLDEQWGQLLANEPVKELEAAMASADELRTYIQKTLAGVELQLADDAERAARASGSELAEIRKEDADARAQRAKMEAQIQALARENQEREKLITPRYAHRDVLDAERKAALATLASVEARLRDARNETGYRGERLRIVDPGVAPERPSSPNLPLNAAAALLLGVVIPALFLVLRASYGERRGASSRAAVVTTHE